MTDEAKPSPPLAPRSRVAWLLGTDTGPPIGPSYILRTASSAVIALLVCRALGFYALWAVVSAVVVIQPEVRASVSATSVRVVANFVGAGVGVALAAFASQAHLPALVLGIVSVGILCRLLGIDAAARSGCVALVVVLLKDPSSVVDNSRTRVLGVLLGCSIALVVTGVAVVVEKRLRGSAVPQP